MELTDGTAASDASQGRRPDLTSPPIVIATMHRAEGITGVQTHVRQFREHLERHGVTAPLVTPFSWGGPLIVPVFGPRLLLARLSGPASVVWHRHWHEVFLHNALRRHLARADECVVYAQGPLAARAALRARRGPHQRVVMAVHFRVSQADEWADKRLIGRDGKVFRRIRQVERDVIPQLDGLVSVTAWARDALVRWLPEAATVPSAVIGNFVHPQEFEVDPEPLGDLVTVGNLELVKNHRFLLEVLAEANRRGRRYTLDVYGEGPCRADLSALARSLGLEGQVRLRGFRTDVRTFLPRYRAYVHAAYSESSSLAIMEAMAAGLPIVAGYLEPLAELCDEGVEGRFFPLGDATRAADVLVELLDCAPARAKAARAARERFHRDFDAEVVAPRLRSFLQTGPPRPAGPSPHRDRREHVGVDHAPDVEEIGTRSDMPVYVINLARSLDRREHVTSELRKTGMAYEIVTAVDGRDVDLRDPATVAPELLAKNDFPAGTAGCALSHLRVYEKVIADGSDHALVLEDDVTLPADLGTIVDEVARELTGAEVALLNYGSPDPCKMSREGSVALGSSRVLALPIHVTGLVNAAAYVITREACERMISNAPPLRANADDWHFFYEEGILDRIRCVLPLPVGKTARFESTIGLYSLGDGFKARLVRPLVHRRIPVVHQVILHRRERILRQWGRSELVNTPFVDKPSRLG